MSDQELLRRFAEERDDSAFRDFVHRHFNLVYFAALRQVNDDRGLAEEIAQAVFTAAARKAGRLRHHPALTGWLYTSSRFAATKASRAERRRRVREQEAYAMNQYETDPRSLLNWPQLRPVIDDALHDLSADDRELVLQRFFEDRGYSEIASAMSVSEDAIRKRLQRALDRLQAALGRRGIESTTVALGLALSNGAGLAAPAGLAGTVAAAVIAGGNPGLASSAAAAIALFMATSKNLVIPAIVAVAGLVTGFQQQSSVREREQAIAAAQSNTAKLQVRIREAGARAGVVAAMVSAPPAPTPVPVAPVAMDLTGPVELEGNPGHLTPARIVAMENARIVYSPILPALHLTPEEMYRFLNLMVDLANNLISQRPTAMSHAGSPTANPRVYQIYLDAVYEGTYARVAELLGSERYAIWQEWRRNSPEKPAASRTNALSQQMAAAGIEPLNESQTVQMRKLLARTGPEVEAIKGVPIGFVNHMPVSQSAAVEASTFLSPAQAEYVRKIAATNPNTF